MFGRRTALASMIGLATTAPARAAGQHWRIVTEYPETAISGEGVAAFAATATRLAAGALVVEPGFNGPEGLRSAGMMAAVAAKQVTAADAFTGALAGEAPIFQLSALPFLTTSEADTARLLKLARPAYAKALAARGLRLLYATPWPATGLWSRTALAGPEALRGLRVRTYDAASTAVMQAAGAAPSKISFADAVPLLKAGLLDAVLSSGDGGAGARLWEVLPHFTVLDYASPLSLAFCGAAAMEALDINGFIAMEDACTQTEARQFEAIRTRTAANTARMQAHGVTIATVPALRAALRSAAAPVVQAWMQQAGAEGAAIIEAYRQG